MKKSGKIIKINNSSIKRLSRFKGVLYFLLVLLVVRLAYLQIIKGPSLSKEASSQQTSTRTIDPSRGTIYDSNGKVLAISAEVDTVSVNPSKLKDSREMRLIKILLQILLVIFLESIHLKF